MFCEKCGKKIEEGNHFCEHCGAAKPEEKGTTGKANELKEKFNSLDKKKKGMILGGAGLLLLVIILFACSSNGKSKGIQLSDYVIVETSGYDGYGTAQWNFDFEKFEKEWGKKLTFNSKTKRIYGSWTTPMELFKSGIRSGSLDKASDLSNGDTITFTWGNLSEEFSEIFANKMNYKDLSITVDNLEKIDSFDAFKDIVIEYQGCEPFATAQVVNNSQDDFLKGLVYNVENGSDLSEGDTITVTVSGRYFYDDDFATYCVENYGKVPLAETKEYKVQGLNRYVSSINQIPEEFLSKMKAEVEDGLRAEAARDWEEYVALENITYLGSYVLNPKTSNKRNSNQIYLVYKIDVHENYPEYDMDNHVSFYYFGTYNNVMLLADGTCSTDLSAMSPCQAQFTRTTNIKSWGVYKKLYYPGYEDLDSLFNKCVTAQIDNYTYENTVQDTVEEITEKTEAPIEETEVSEETEITEEETQVAEPETSEDVTTEAAE